MGGIVVGTEFPEGVEGKLNLIDAKPGNKIFFQQSAFKQGKEYGIRLEVSMHGQPISLKDFGINQNMMKLPKTYNIGDFFAENSSCRGFIQKYNNLPVNIFPSLSSLVQSEQ